MNYLFEAKKAIYFSLLFFGFSFFSFAGGWVNNVTVVRFYDADKKQVLVQLSSYNNPTGCKLADGFHVSLDPLDRSMLMKHLTLAFYQATPIDIYVTDGCVETHWKDVTFGKLFHIKLPSVSN